MLGYGVKETTVTTGTGTLTLAAVTGYPRFASAFATNDLVEYSLLDSTGAPLECGIGTVSASNTLARTYPLVTWNGTTYSNNAPSAISLAGVTTVICTGSPGSGFPFVQAFSASATNKACNSMHMSCINSGTFVLIANTLYIHPFLHVVNRPFAGLMVRVSSAAGTNATLGLYRCGTTGDPTNLLNSGNIVVSGAGLKTMTFSAWYPPGWYYLAMVADAGPTINCQNSAGTQPQWTPLGTDTNNQGINAFSFANGSITLPNPYSGAHTNLVNSISYPVISAVYA